MTETPDSGSSPSPAPSPEPLHLETGSTLLFGQADGAPLLWRVLESEGTGALLLCDALPAARAYDEDGVFDGWEDCDLSRWLYEEWLPQTLSAEELAAVCGGDASPGAAARCVFLLSEEEANRCFPDAQARVAHDVKSGEPASWWLRDAAKAPGRAKAVNPDGFIPYRGKAADDPGVFVRPALRIRADAFLIESAPPGASSGVPRLSPVPGLSSGL